MQMEWSAKVAKAGEAAQEWEAQLAHAQRLQCMAEEEAAVRADEGLLIGFSA